MPRKTRREKVQKEIRKSYNRPIETFQLAEQSTPINQNTDNETYQFSYSKTSKSTQANFVSKYHFQQVRSDLLKTLLLSSIALAIEYALFVTLK